MQCNAAEKLKGGGGESEGLVNQHLKSKNNKMSNFSLNMPPLTDLGFQTMEYQNTLSR